MSKKRKKMMSKINPEKSNKMIYAVGFGVLVLFLTGVFFIINEDKKRDIDPYLQVSEILLNSKEITKVNYDKDLNTYKIVIRKKSKKVMRLINTKALDISNMKRKIKFTFLIFLKTLDTPAYSLMVKDGKIINFKTVRR